MLKREKDQQLAFQKKVISEEYNDLNLKESYFSIRRIRNSAAVNFQKRRIYSNDSK
jgi:hypothetical protein